MTSAERTALIEAMAKAIDVAPCYVMESRGLYFLTPDTLRSFGLAALVVAEPAIRADHMTDANIQVPEIALAIQGCERHASAADFETLGALIYRHRDVVTNALISNAALRAEIARLGRELERLKGEKASA